MPCHQLYLAVNKSCKVVNTLEIGHGITVKSSVLVLSCLTIFHCLFFLYFQILEICLAGEHIQRVASPEEVISSVKSLQQSSLVCSKLNHGSVAGCGEVCLDLFVPGEATPRYTVHVLDQPYAKETGRRFAAFIVPQGRQVLLLILP